MAVFDTFLMNTKIWTDELEAAQACRIFVWMKAVEERFSRFLPSSELSQVNASAGQTVHVSRLFAEIFFEALRYFNETDGLFSPFLGQLMERIGYDRSFEKIPRQRPSLDSETVSARAPKAAVFDLDRCVICIPQQQRIDFGGIAKGWAVQKAGERLIAEKQRSGLINAGGDLFFWGNRPEQPRIILLKALKQEQPIGRLLMIPGSAGVATSSTIRRSWVLGGHRMHHIIDPRSGEPSASETIQATVIGPTVLIGEIYAKCLLILGTARGGPWLQRRHPDLAWIGIDRSGKISHSENLLHFCRVELPNRLDTL